MNQKESVISSFAVCLNLSHKTGHNPDVTVTPTQHLRCFIIFNKDVKSSQYWKKVCMEQGFI